MEASVEARLTVVERRLERIETALGLAPFPPPERPRPFPAPAPAAPSAPRGCRTAREPLDLEDLLGGRILAWVGGFAVVLAAVFFLVMAVHDGWIGVDTRIALAFAASAALVGLGAWLHEAKGRAQAARATVAAGLAAFYASDTAATVHYQLLPAAAGLVVAGLVGALAVALTIRWSSQEIAGLGIVGALLAPVLVQAGDSTAALVFTACALASAVGVLVWQRWSWLGPAAFLVSAPQLADWLYGERWSHLGAPLVVSGLFWALFVVAAVGYELRDPTVGLRLGSAFLLLVDGSLTALAGWWLLHLHHHDSGATAWVLGLAAAHLVCGSGVLRSRISREIGLLLVAVGSALAAVGLALALSGPALVVAWAAEAVVLAWAGARTGERRGAWASLLLLGTAAIHALIWEARPGALVYGLPSVPQAVIACSAVAAACVLTARLDSELRDGLLVAAAVAAVYLGSLLVVDAAGAHSGSVVQHAQVALSAFWAVLGFGALAAGLLGSKRWLRLGGLGLLGVAVAKVFLVDLAELQSGYRVVSFLALGLLLLAGAFAYQRLRTRAEVAR